ncbi:MAG: ArsR family transcriptional regulator [Telluria sp.]
MSAVNPLALERANNIRRLIAEITAREMSRDEIHTFLGFSPSGCRKYINPLHDAGVIEIARRLGASKRSLGQPVYCISSDAKRVTRFLAGLATNEPPPPRGARTQLEIAQRDPTRHFHLLRDDIGYQVRVSRNHVKRDPLALPPEFFAPSPGYCERRITEPVEQVRVTGFAALAGVRFELGAGA